MINGFKQKWYKNLATLEQILQIFCISTTENAVRKELKYPIRSVWLGTGK